MSSNLQAALDFLSKFPDAKLFPAKYEDNSHRGHICWGAGSSNDPAQIKAWAKSYPDCYFCCNYRASGIRVIDIDMKKGKNGKVELMSLELANEDLPDTLTASTPSGGGLHLYFIGECAFSIGKLGMNGTGKKSGIDIPGMTPIPGSSVPGKGEYKILKDVPAAQLPAWWIGLTGEFQPRQLNRETGALVELDMDHNVEKAVWYLKEQAPEAIEGSNGDFTAYCVAAKVRDFGISMEKASELIHEHYAVKCNPQDLGWLEEKVANAYNYAQNAQIGTLATKESAEEAFKDIEPTEPQLNDIERLNKEFAVAVIGAKTFIIQEKEDDVVPMRKNDFETFLQNQRIWVGDEKPKSVPLSKIWLEDPDRRQVHGICFSPQGCKDGWINLWRGFSVVPAPEDAEKKCSLYRKHVENIICSGDKTHIKYVWAWLSDMVKNPGGRKPGVALVLRGGRGTGKGMFARPLLQIFGRHGIQLNNREHLVGRFNHHLSDKILVFLDEAFWAGEKRSEGVLKGLITEPSITVERKGVDAFHVDSYVRCIMASNEDWVVPAGPDERRFLVLDVSEDHKQDSLGYFKALSSEIDNGGTEALLAWLLAYEADGVDLFHAPESKARLDQKKESLEPAHAWWLDCLYKGVVYDHEWPDFLVPRLALYAYNEWAKTWPGNTYMSSEKLARKIYGSKGVCQGFRSQCMVGSERENGYRMPTLAEARTRFEEFLGGKIEWEVFDDL